MRIIDLMCSDYIRARDNREMVRLKENTEGYLFIESLVRSWPRNKRLPDRFYGQIPTVSKSENLYGFHEVE